MVTVTTTTTTSTTSLPVSTGTVSREEQCRQVPIQLEKDRACVHNLQQTLIMLQSPKPSPIIPYIQRLIPSAIIPGNKYHTPIKLKSSTFTEQIQVGLNKCLEGGQRVHYSGPGASSRGYTTAFG